MKRKIVNNISAVAPIIWGLLIVGGAIASIGAYSYFQQPDVTYNISEGIFSFAGLELGGLEILLLAVVGIFALVYLFRNRSS